MPFSPELRLRLLPSSAIRGCHSFPLPSQLTMTPIRKGTGKGFQLGIGPLDPFSLASFWAGKEEEVPGPPCIKP